MNLLLITNEEKQSQFIGAFKDLNMAQAVKKCGISGEVTKINNNSFLVKTEIFNRVYKVEFYKITEFDKFSIEAKKHFQKFLNNERVNQIYQ